MKKASTKLRNNVCFKTGRIKFGILQKDGGRVPAASRAVESGQSLDAIVDIPLDNMNDSSQKQRKLADWEAEFRKREMDIKREERTLLLNLVFKSNQIIESMHN